MTPRSGEWWPAERQLRELGTERGATTLFSRTRVLRVRSKIRRQTMTTSTGHTSAIRASKVIGTVVKDSAGERLGKVEDVVLDKQSNNIMFGVMSFGGVLGIGEKYHPVPWAALNYDETEGAYVINMTKDQLKAAPADSLEELTRNDGQGYRDRAFAYYKVPRA
jgi:sporulation protein YlmC with PRC-barrel domain